MSAHPLALRSRENEVRQAKSFREAAMALTGESLAAEFQQELASAPRRAEAKKKFLIAPNSRLAAEFRPSRASEHAALALVDWCGREGGLPLPGDIGAFEALASPLMLRSAPADRERDPGDANFGVDRLEAAGIGPEDRLAVAALRFTPPGANRVGTGDTPLRALLEALVQTAVVQANREALIAEMQTRSERTISDAPPLLLLIGSQRYWELCRKREAQRGAVWIRELERLAKEFEEHAGVAVSYLALRVNGEPGWNYDHGSPRFDGEVRLLPAWEHGAGRPRPKPKPRSRTAQAQPADQVVEADLDRPVRAYAFTDRYESGDRIEHPTLGLGVVQGLAGTMKIHVLFDDKKSVLVHARPSEQV